MRKDNNKLDAIIKENLDKLKFSRKGPTKGLPKSSWLDNYKEGGIGPYANFPSTGMLTSIGAGPKVPTMANGGPGPRKPIYVSDINDPRLKAYNDSLNKYNIYHRADSLISSYPNVVRKESGNKTYYTSSTKTPLGQKFNPLKILLHSGTNKHPNVEHEASYYGFKDRANTRTFSMPTDKKPVQPVEFNPKKVGKPVYTLQKITKFIPKPEPKLKGKVAEVNKLPMGEPSQAMGIRERQMPNIQSPSKIDLGRYKVDYFDPTEGRDVQGGWQTRSFRSAKEADDFMKQRNKDNTFYGPSMTQRVEYALGGPTIYNQEGFGTTLQTTEDPSVKEARDCGKDCGGKKKGIIDYSTSAERRQEKAWDKELAKQEARDAEERRKASENYINIQYDYSGYPLEKTDYKTRKQEYNQFLQTNPTFAKDPTYMGKLTPEQRYALLNNTLQYVQRAPQISYATRLSKKFNITDPKKLTMADMMNYANQMGGYDKFREWVDAGGPEIQKYGGSTWLKKYDDGGQGPCPTNMYWDTLLKTCVPRPAPFVTSDYDEYFRRKQLASDSTNAAINSRFSIEENNVNSANQKTTTNFNQSPTLLTTDKSYKDKPKVAKRVIKYKNEPPKRYTTDQYKEKLIKEGNTPQASNEFVDQSASVISGNQVINPVAITTYPTTGNDYDEKGNIISQTGDMYIPEFQEAKQQVKYKEAPPKYSITYSTPDGRQITFPYIQDYESWKQMRDRFAGSRAFVSSQEKGDKSEASFLLSGLTEEDFNKLINEEYVEGNTKPIDNLFDSKPSSSEASLQYVQANNKKYGGDISIPDLTQDSWITKYDDGGKVKGKIKKRKESLEQKIDRSLGNPMYRGSNFAASIMPGEEVDNARHYMTGALVNRGIQNKFPSWMQKYTPIPKIAGFIGSNALGAGHEANVLYKDILYKDRSNHERSLLDQLRESGEDMVNNLIGSVAGTIYNTPREAEELYHNLFSKNLLPDGVVDPKGREFYLKKEGQKKGKFGKYGPGGEVTDGCPPYFTKNAFGICVNALGQTPDQAEASRTTISNAVKTPVKKSIATTPYKTRSQVVQEATDRADREKYGLGEFAKEQPSIRQGREQTVGEKRESDRKKKIYDETHPYAERDSQGDLVRKQWDRNMEGGADPYTKAARTDKGLEHIMNALETTGTITGVGSVGSNLLRLGAGALETQIGRNLLSRNLKNFTSRINPTLTAIDNAAAYVQMDPIGIMGNRLNSQFYNPTVALNTANNTLTGVGRNLKNSAIETADVFAGQNNLRNIVNNNINLQTGTLPSFNNISSLDPNFQLGLIYKKQNPIVSSLKNLKLKDVKQSLGNLKEDVGYLLNKPKTIEDIKSQRILERELGKPLTDNKGSFNEGVYRLKRFPETLVKFENTNKVANAMNFPGYKDFNFVRAMEGLPQENIATIRHQLNLPDDRRALFMNELPGKSLYGVDPRVLRNIPESSISDTYTALKKLRNKQLGFDFAGDNFNFNTNSKRINLFDINPIPSGNDRSFWRQTVLGGGDPLTYGIEGSGQNLKEALKDKLRKYNMTAIDEKLMEATDRGTGLKPETLRSYNNKAIIRFEEKLARALDNMSPYRYGGLTKHKSTKGIGWLSKYK